ncbi:methylated-DNA--[protein]-cysteine S-methyltransferase [Thalassotalea nanhaiensis]|uniref:Methylated-DNA--protein-cysteine methyltransferase n=1 Tax=Thalassotalea nanhaiensis TaxID=3065648 RepID=A0ABY9TN39_9GAMM|nr:methylated-DNA--[protein]-cysteine S-methyltransferase [Colwelliaceae bacterium SQ345]
MKKYYDILTTDCGDIAIIANNEGIIEVAFQQGKVAVEITKDYQLADEHAPVHLAQAKQQLTEYFSGSRQSFDLPLSQHGTIFQNNVWQALTKIPFGKTINYGQLASNINNPKAVRAVGTANGANKIAIIVPCHRVIGRDKKLTGYAGGMGIKAKLLMLEGAHFKV